MFFVLTVNREMATVDLVALEGQGRPPGRRVRSTYFDHANRSRMETRADYEPSPSSSATRIASSLVPTFWRAFASICTLLTSLHIRRYANLAFRLAVARPLTFTLFRAQRPIDHSEEFEIPFLRRNIL